MIRRLALLLASISFIAAAQENPAARITGNHAITEAGGTVRMQRVIPLPKSLSPEAKAWLSRPLTEDGNVPQTIEQRRSGLDASQARHRDELLKLFPVTVKDSAIAEVPVREVVPVTLKHKDRVLICLHGGGYNADSGSYSESIPVAGLTGVRVVSVLYRLAPEHPFPAGVDDVIAVYKELLKNYKPSRIGIFGSSAGAGLTLQAAVKIKQLKLPMPAALGPFSATASMAEGGDSRSLYNTDGLRGYVPVPDGTQNAEYVGTTDRHDPVLSPIYADLRNMPPTLFITSERDLLLSDTSSLSRAFLKAGNRSQLIVFEGLPHCFWNNNSLPESREAWGYMADFFDRELGH
ncbi:alpha/beta hydrolase [Terriglobus tenax]|uniref:alpha/beta hydrolase n=1 Tax=Terriglobus tenax TaxID=1111115 RepID=UPI0021E0472D|nr:alpha/beta hydrolase [Terriglobus tenax]